VQIDWITISLLVVGFFAISGFSRGWWREAVTTAAIALFILLIQQPALADRFIGLINKGIAAVWPIFVRLFGSIIPLEVTPYQLDPQQGTTWLILFIVVLGGLTLLTRLFLPGSAGRMPGHFYSPTLLARLLGFGLGTLNGFLILGLIREFLDGRSLPGQAPEAATAAAGGDITVISSNAYPPAATSVNVELVDLPSFTIFDNIIPWIIVGIGALTLLSLLQSRIAYSSTAKGRKVGVRAPWGYRTVDFKKPKQDPPMKVEVINQ
jgi:hypothetical protein